MFNLETTRKQTRSSGRIAHLNNCGAALPPDIVVDAMIDHLNLERDLGPYEAAAAAAERASRVYDAAGRLLGCGAEEIAYCDSATRAWNVLVYSLSLKPGDRILVSPTEFGSALIAIQHVAERSGATVEVLPADAEGRIRLDAAEKVLRTHAPAVVAVTHAAAHSGAVNDVRAIGRLAKDAGAFYLVDACQSLGQMRMSVDDLLCDALTATGRKWLRGPRGTGFLYIRKERAAALDPTTADLVTADYFAQPDASTGSRLKIRPDARKFELWERSVAGAIGLGTALQYLLDLSESDDGAYNRIRELAQYTVDALAEIKRVHVWGPRQAESGVIGFTVDGIDAKAVKAACAAQGVNISTMADYDAPLDFARRASTSVCRVAPHYYNTTDEIDTFVHILRSLA